MKKTFLFLLAAAGVLYVLYASHAALLRGYASFFTVSTATKGADALVLLAGGSETRLPKIVELYSAGYAPLVLLTDIRQPNSLAHDIGCDYYARIQRMLDVLQVSIPFEKVPSLKGGATSTFDEAYDLREYCSRHTVTHLIIVTDNCHTRRALYAFEKVFKGSGILVEAAGAANSIYNESNWWTTERGVSAYVLETIKYTLYLFSRGNSPYVENS